MELVIIILLVVLFVLLMILTILNHLRKSERQKYYAAAGNILREEFLNYSIQNTISPDSGRKTQFVFDPEKVIRIGRDSGESNIFINDAAVSQFHCRIYSQDDHVYLQDMRSSNGTFLKRGLLKSYGIYDGNQIELRTGDRITVGSSEFDVCLFYYDLNTM